MVRKHVDHCIETLRMNLMCTADVTPYLIWNDPDGVKGETPSFNTLHKCRKWEPIVNWVKEHVIFNGTAKGAAEEMAKANMWNHEEHHHEGWH
jgi:mycotoxin biosynthesis protein UstYa